MSRRSELLRPRLDGERERGTEDGGHGDGDREARSRVNVRRLSERKCKRHEQRCNGGLHKGDLREGSALRGAPEEDDVQSEGDGAAEGEEVSAIDAGPVCKRGLAWRNCHESEADECCG